MGLAGRKQKQRIGADPRNLTWADDAAKFGQAYLSKMGWDPSKGLGAENDGRTSHIKVVQKLNLLGIGAGPQQGPDAIAWRQNRDYEMLLKRLNQCVETNEKTETEAKGEDAEDQEENGTKRKYDSISGLEGEEESNEGRKKKKDKKDKKDKEEKKKKEKTKGKKEKGEEDGKEDESDKGSGSLTETPEPTTVNVPMRRPMAHRARFLRSKQLASRSSTAVNEILGVSGASTPSSYPASGSATPYPPDSALTSRSDTPVPETDQELTTSTKSVADYFKEKLAARALARSTAASPSLNTPSPLAPKDEEDAPRAGLGSRSSAFADYSEDARPGLGSSMKFGSLMGGLGFAKASSSETSSIPVEAKAEVLTKMNEEAIIEEDTTKKKKKKSSKNKEKETADEAGSLSESNTLEISKEASTKEDASTGKKEDDKEQRRKEKEERKARKKEKKEKKEKKKSQKEKGDSS